MDINIPGTARLRRMLTGESVLFYCRDTGPRTDSAVASVQSKIGGKFGTQMRVMLPVSGMLLQGVCIVTCIEAAPPHVRKPRTKKQKAVQPA